MDFSHVHFYVDDAVAWQRWFSRVLGFEAVSDGPSILGIAHPQTRTSVVRAGHIAFVLSSPCGSDSPVARYLQQHPPGVVDVALRVDDLDEIVSSATAQGAKLLSPIAIAVTDGGPCRWACVSGWGSLRHTLIEAAPAPAVAPLPSTCISAIDHAVLNVPQGDMALAADWYAAAFNLQPNQTFVIETEHSALHSQVLKHPSGNLQLPINEPTSPSSQIQEFLDVNRGSGIQHIALQTVDIVVTVRQLRQRGLPFLAVPGTYYDALPQRPGFSLSSDQQRAIAQQEILVDWQDGQSQLLLQTFTRPIFKDPTFFFELIQRQTYSPSGRLQYANGFGEGNFQALFEAMEREQMKRGSL